MGRGCGHQGMDEAVGPHAFRILGGGSAAHTRHVTFLVIFPHNLCIRRNTPQSDQTGESFLLIRNRLVSYDKNEYTNNGRHRASSNEFALA